MELRSKSDDTKIFTALICFFIGSFFIWSLEAHITTIYELHLTKETCDNVKTYGLTPTADCVITAPFRPFVLVPGGSLILPDGSDIQIYPVTINETNKAMEWTSSMKAKFIAALLAWAATLALLLSAFRNAR